MERIWNKHKQINPVGSKTPEASADSQANRTSDGVNTTLKPRSRTRGSLRGRPKVFVAMSGGVDSSVAAALLKKDGYDVTGVFMKNWSDSSFFNDKTQCPWAEDQESARKAAAVLGIPFYTFDFEKEYREKVVSYMIEGYRTGITPNPDVMCNKEIKFGLFFDKAAEMGADYIATGHYARVRAVKSQKSKVKNYEFLAGADTNKDQSYFLWTLTQKQLVRTLFPIGDYTKPQVRELARRFGLPNAEKKDSQGLCFIGNIDVFEFLKSQIPSKKGKVMTFDGRVIGEHSGVQFFTIGQRHGIGSPGGGMAYYVARKDIVANILHVAEGAKDDHLYKKELIVEKINWISGDEPEFLLVCEARIRYRQPLQSCKVYKFISSKVDKSITHQFTNLSTYQLKIVFDNPQRAVTPGQSIVFYDGDVVLGGGIIDY